MGFDIKNDPRPQTEFLEQHQGDRPQREQSEVDKKTTTLKIGCPGWKVIYMLYSQMVNHLAEKLHLYSS